MTEALFLTNQALKHSLEFSSAIIEYCELLGKKRKLVLGCQLLEYGTSIGTIIMEARHADSKAEFIYKMKIAAREAEETQSLLLLCSDSDKYPPCMDLIAMLQEIQKLLGEILSIAKSKLTLP